MGRKAKYSKDVKIKACEDYINGKDSSTDSSTNIYLSIGCAESVFHRWVQFYRLYGASCFDDKPRNAAYTNKFKLKVVKEYIEGKGSHLDLALKYNLRTPSTVLVWVNKCYNGEEIKDYIPKGDVYTMKSRKTTFEERLKIVEWCIANNKEYKLAAEQFDVPYAQVYKWTNEYLKQGVDSLNLKKRGRKPENYIEVSSLTIEEKLRRDLESANKKIDKLELTLEVFKKKQEIEDRLNFQWSETIRTMKQSKN